MNLLRLEVKDRQFLPLQRVCENLIKQTVAHSDDEWFIADARVNVVAFDFSKRHRGERLLTCFGFGRVFGSERTECDNQLWLIESILRQVRGDIFDKLC